MHRIRSIVPFLWFDHRAEQAALFYTGIFDNSRIVAVRRYGAEGREVHQRPVGSVMTVDFELDRHPFTALNGGPLFKFTEAISFVVLCDRQEEVDYFWGKLSDGGDLQAQQCGWLKDRYGVSWQVVPAAMLDMLGHPDSAGSERAMKAMLQMKKLDLAALQRAFDG